ncbi:MAG: TIGR01212 family radical SAM protein [Oligoflexia bacterium]|nr:TIGR01212 family radical SAM protein [Oligoflexia bacterium]
MDSNPHWKGLPFYPISSHYQKIFGDKIVKLPLSFASTCPNRMGLQGMKTCSFCDETGSFAYPENQNLSLTDQIEIKKKDLLHRYKASGWVAYFQAYTTTLMSVQKLEMMLEALRTTQDFEGVIIGTRPDCLSDQLFELLNRYQKIFPVSIELGVQSFCNEALQWMNRGHSAEKAIAGIKRLARRCSIDMGIHLIFGWPNESIDDIKKAAAICNELPINHVKLHNLHVLKGTELATHYSEGRFNPESIEVYSEKVISFLEELNPEIAIHRLTAVVPRWNQLIAPEWVRAKMESRQYIIDSMNRHGRYQGRFFKRAFAV